MLSRRTPSSFFGARSEGVHHQEQPPLNAAVPTDRSRIGGTIRELGVALGIAMPGWTIAAGDRGGVVDALAALPRP